eukprot:gene2564-2940_t
MNDELREHFASLPHQPTHTRPKIHHCFKCGTLCTDVIKFRNHIHCYWDCFSSVKNLRPTTPVKEKRPSKPIIRLYPEQPSASSLHQDQQPIDTINNINIPLATDLIDLTRSPITTKLKTSSKKKVSSSSSSSLASKSSITNSLEAKSSTKVIESNPRSINKKVTSSIAAAAAATQTYTNTVAPSKKPRAALKQQSKPTTATAKIDPLYVAPTQIKKSFKMAFKPTSRPLGDLTNSSLSNATNNIRAASSMDQQQQMKDRVRTRRQVINTTSGRSDPSCRHCAERGFNCSGYHILGCTICIMLLTVSECKPLINPSSNSNPTPKKTPAKKTPAKKTLTAIYNEGTVGSMAQAISECVDIPRDAIRVAASFDTHLIVSKLASVTQFGPVNFKGLFSTMRLSIELATHLLQSLYDMYGERTAPLPTLSGPSTSSPTHANLAEIGQVINNMHSIQAHLPSLPSPKEEGSYLYASSLGDIQVGVPPETIKTSLKAHASVPQIYVLPHILCAHGVSYGEVEFPVFFNFFINKAASNPNARVVMVGHEHQLARVRAIFKESMFGPDASQLYIEEEISARKKELGYSIDFAKERATLAYTKDGKEAPLSDFMIFKAFDESGSVVVGDAVTITSRNGLICFYEDGKLRGLVDSTITATSTPRLAAPSPMLAPLSKPTLPKFSPPTLGLTFLGTSHGFDPNGSTTGFIIWINGAGVLVDPPIGTTTYLAQHGLAGHFVEHVILTHCHSDHDSGLLQKIVEGVKITLYTTKTINESYKRKARALTGIDNIGDFYNWVPITIGDAIKIQGADFEFDYSYHTIPTIRFKLRFHDKTIAYSADTHYCPIALGKLVTDGVISPQRESSLRLFVFDADVIIHECGVPPIHTSAAALNDLPESIKRKLLVVHTARIPETVTRSDGTVVVVDGLRIPPVGLAATIVVPVGDHAEGYSLAVRRFQLLCNSFYFRHMSPAVLYRTLHAMEEQYIEAGTTIIEAGARCDRCYVIESGAADVLLPSSTTAPVIDRHTYFDSPTLSSIGGKIRDTPAVTSGSPVLIGRFFAGETFGENALWKEQARRSATVVARTDMTLLSISHDAFAKLQEQHQQDESFGSLTIDLEKIALYAPFMFNVLSKTFPFSELKLCKEAIDHFSATVDSEVVFCSGATIIRENDSDDSMYIIKEGAVTLSKAERDFKTLGKGECFGEISLILGLPRTCTARASSAEPTRLLILKRPGFQRILDKYQNIKYNLTQLVEQRISEGINY